jgi:galactokinase/mevalonate kinase-like predicted kinase
MWMAFLYLRTENSCKYLVIFVLSILQTNCSPSYVAKRLVNNELTETRKEAVRDNCKVLPGISFDQLRTMKMSQVSDSPAESRLGTSKTQARINK